MDLQLDGKTALVLGASKGWGAPLLCRWPMRARM